MSEKLTIKDFGPIKNVTLELRVINILIGEQGTGKSTVAKLLTAIKGVTVFPEKNLSINGKTGSEEQNTKDFLNDFKKELETYGIIYYLKPDSFIEFSDSFAYLKYENQKIEVRDNHKEAKAKKTHVIGYIPAYREAAVLLKDDLNAIFLVGTTLPKIFYSFGQSFSVAKNKKSSYNYMDVLGVEYRYVNGKDIIILENGREIDISEASSAINSGIPLLTVFDNAVELNYPTSYQASHHLNCPYIIIEEPELNCFPATQNKMMHHFISKIKYETPSGSDYYCRLLITTHSPYILTSLNNMMYAYKVWQKDKEKNKEKVEEVVESKYWLNPADVSAYLMKADGNGVEDIMDAGEGLIMAEKIDEVSRVLNKQFDDLLNIEFKEEWA